jgi:sugar/nucleoside kinase (ribokinase family)
MPYAIFVGLSTIDVVYRVDRFPEANTKIAAQSQSVDAGGPATNAAIACAYLGGPATLVSAVGRNALAGVIRDELTRYGVQLIDLNPDFDGVPAISSVSVDLTGNRNVVSANAAGISAPAAKADEELCRQAHIVMVDGHHMHACQAWAAAARTSGIPVVLDGGSWKPGTDELLKSTDTAICSADFMPPGCSSASDVIRFLKEVGITNIAITDGPAPIQVLAGDSATTIPIPQVEAIDTTGAGDILHGAYCCYASQGIGFVDALTQAARIASNSCRYVGTREWMRH